MGVSWFCWGAVSSSRPADARAARTAAVKDGRRPPPQAARSVLDGGEHDATLKAARAKNQPMALFRLTPKGERSLNREPAVPPNPAYFTPTRASAVPHAPRHTRPPHHPPPAPPPPDHRIAAARHNAYAQRTASAHLPASALSPPPSAGPATGRPEIAPLRAVRG